MRRGSIFAIAVLVLGLGTLTTLSTTRATQEVAPEVQERLEHLRADLDEVKEDLPYACCINPACNFCALVDGACPCATNIETEAGVCGECLLGWHAGLGHAPGVEAADVKGLSGDALKTMYEKLEKHFSGHTHEH